jgi:glycosyltransferase involved in cell wall biosynthesis
MHVSVLMPAYNRGHFIEAAIASVLNQLSAGDELLLVDDGSTDNTAQILQQYSRQPRFRCIKKNHSNAPDTRNRAIAEARNPWLLWLDSDDILMPKTLAYYRKMLCRYPEVDVFYGNLLLCGDLQNTKFRLDPRMRFRDYYRKNEQLRRDLFYANRLPNPGTLVRKAVYERYGSYDTRFLRIHDYEFWVRTAPYIQVKHCKRIVCQWRWHDSNMSSGSVDRDFKYDIMLLDRILELYTLEEIFPFFNRTDEKSARARCCCEIGRQYHNLGHYMKAMDYLLKSIRLKPLPKAYLEILLLASTFPHLLAEGVKTEIPGDVIQKARQILSRAQGKSYLEKYRIASLHKRLGNLDLAGRKLIALAASLQEKKKYAHLLAGAYFHLGEINVFKQEYAKARERFNHCLEIIPGHKKARQYVDDFACGGNDPPGCTATYKTGVP